MKHLKVKLTLLFNNSENKKLFLARTKKNIYKFNEEFYEMLQYSLSDEQINSLSYEDSLSILIGSQNPKIKKRNIQKFLFWFGIKKIVQLQNDIFKNIVDQNDVWKFHSVELSETNLENILNELQAKISNTESTGNFIDDVDWENNEEFIDLRNDNDLNERNYKIYN